MTSLLNLRRTAPKVPFCQTIVGCPSGAVVAPVDLTNLGYLSAYKSAAEQDRNLNGPHLVGRVIDEAALRAPLAHHDWMICTTGNKYRGWPNMVEGKLLRNAQPGGPFVVQDLKLDSIAELPSQDHRAIIGGILKIDAALGFRLNALEVHYDQRDAGAGKSQRGSAWACVPFAPGSPNELMPRAYTVCSLAGQLYLRDEVRSGREAWTQEFFLRGTGNLGFAKGPDLGEALEKIARSKDMLVETKPYEIHLSTPNRSWTRGSKTGSDVNQSYLRVVCS